jgi:hypothetical protein
MAHSSWAAPVLQFPSLSVLRPRRLARQGSSYLRRSGKTIANHAACAVSLQMRGILDLVGNEPIYVLMRVNCAVPVGLFVLS